MQHFDIQLFINKKYFILVIKEKINPVPGRGGVSVVGLSRDVSGGQHF